MKVISEKKKNKIDCLTKLDRKNTQGVNIVLVKVARPILKKQQQKLHFSIMNQFEYLKV